MHAAAPGKLVAVRADRDAQPVRLRAARRAVSGESAVYAPHVYTYVFDADPARLENLQPADLEPSMKAARAEATAWQTPLLISEFGIGPTSPNADLWMGVAAAAP